jgi:hypothetical protein
VIGLANSPINSGADVLPAVSDLRQGSAVRANPHAVRQRARLEAYVTVSVSVERLRLRELIISTPCLEATRHNRHCGAL